MYAQLGVLELQDKLVESLSGGERKRLGLAASLVRKPDVILMDEVPMCRIARHLCCSSSLVSDRHTNSHSSPA